MESSRFDENMDLLGDDKPPKFDDHTLLPTTETHFATESQVKSEIQPMLFPTGFEQSSNEQLIATDELSASEDIDKIQPLSQTPEPTATHYEPQNLLEFEMQAERGEISFEGAEHMLPEELQQPMKHGNGSDEKETVERDSDVQRVNSAISDETESLFYSDSHVEKVNLPQPDLFVCTGAVMKKDEQPEDHSLRVQETEESSYTIKEKNYAEVAQTDEKQPNLDTMETSLTVAVDSNSCSVGSDAAICQPFVDESTTNRRDEDSDEQRLHTHSLASVPNVENVESVSDPNLDARETSVHSTAPISTSFIEELQEEATSAIDSTMSGEGSEVATSSSDVTTVKKECPFSPTTATHLIPRIGPQPNLTNECILPTGAWFDPHTLHPVVGDLIYWRDVKKSGVVFGVGLVLLLSFACCSIISVVAYSSLALLLGTFSFRVYKNILQAVQKTSEGNPFDEYLKWEVQPSKQKVHDLVDVILEHFNHAVVKLRNLFLVQDIFDSIKFGVFLWSLTYIGAWFNGITLLILAFISVFSLPKLYEMNKTQVDQYLQLACTHIQEVVSTVRAKIPFPAKKDKTQ